MKIDPEKVKEYEFVKYVEGLNLKLFVSYLVGLRSTKFHWHREIEMILVIDGPVILHTENEQCLLKTDDICFVNSNEAHCLQKTGIINSVLVLQIAHDFCKSYYPELKQTKFLTRHIKKDAENNELHGYIYKYIKDIVYLIHKKEIGYQFSMMSTMNMIFNKLLVYSDFEEVSEEKRVKEARNMKRLNRIIATIQENYIHKISLIDLAEKENLDMYYLSHFIKKYLGMSFQQYLNKLRLAKAVELLMNTNSSNIEICLESGFSDYRYLCKAFTKEYGCTPAQFQEKHLEEYKNNESMFIREVANEQYIISNQEHTYKRFTEYLRSKNQGYEEEDDPQSCAQ
jgi:AraC-like DNA-binding protein/mannose-6-phosphate isomerase-like protein (cupin superfamily)